jgi:hypothetical protein
MTLQTIERHLEQLRRRVHSGRRLSRAEIRGLRQWLGGLRAACRDAASAMPGPRCDLDPARWGIIKAAPASG